jgi:MoCo/4Fe-4S cofactor protein with predicted Tat translocation signal
MPPMTPKTDGSTSMAEAPSSFSLPVVSDPQGHSHDHPHDEHDAIGAALEQAAREGSATEGGYGMTYWRSLEEKLGQPEYLEATRPEFPEGADLPPTGVARREFMQLLGASLALAGATACSTRPVDERIVPYTKTPAELTPGNPLHYASGMTFGGHTSGLLITAREGRPIKVEGNPQHPINQGSAGVFEQSFLLSLYDPQRARVLRQGRSPRSRRTFNEEVSRLVQEASAKDGGARIRFLTDPLNSPLQADLRNRLLKKLPNARFYAYTPLSQDPVGEGTRAVFGESLTPLYDFTKADVILSLDADFLESRPANLRYAREFADRRDPNVGNLNRLYVCEPRFSITGGMADHRLRVKSQQVLAVAAAVAAKVGGTLAGLAQAALQKASLPAESQAWVDAVAAELLASQGRCVVVAGERQPAVVHTLAAALNAALGNVGSTVRFIQAPVAESSSFSVLRTLAEELQAGAVDTLVITAYNPVYTAPADLGLAELLGSANPNRGKLNVVYSALFEDETSELCDWFIPASHELEHWGDGRSIDGTVSIVQPLIQPLFNGVPPSELLAMWLDEPYANSYQLLRNFWRERSQAADFETAWETWVSVGVVPGTNAATVASPTPNFDSAQASVAAYAAPNAGELEVNFVPDYKVYDGRFANLTWLQELPDPISKITWDNAAYLGFNTAERLKLKSGDVAELSYGGRKLEVPVWVLPGLADDVVVLPLGYGRTGLHETVAQKVGFNANLVRSSQAPWFDGGATLERQRKTHKFALTQSHWRMEDRPLALDMTQEQFRTKTGEAEKLKRVRGELPNLMPEFNYEGYKWAMAIDLARCTGCSACVVACQAENNIPVVGKEQVARSREMQWLRIDRYFYGDEKGNTGMIMQPVMCVHCEKAPCEYVCPVNATVHSDEGLNDMVYNRCVGTRYCSNNCPYKVRRFNYLHYTAGKSPTEKMLMNPDVTVRARGVMEKCTYCVQRIERTRIDARVEKRPIADLELQTACQQACPTHAITFGSLHDPNTAVSKLHNDERSYKLLHELGTQPRTVHLVRLRNPNPALAAAQPAKAEAEGGH